MAVFEIVVLEDVTPRIMLGVPLPLVILFNLPKSVEIDLPDFQGLLSVERWVIDLVVNPRFEGLVKSTCPVGRHEQDAGIVIKNSKKHCRLIISAKSELTMSISASPETHLKPTHSS